jgi:GGDEF domain-containing protein
MLEPVSAKGIGEPCASQAAAELTGRLAGSVKAAIGSRGCLARYAEGRLAAILIDTDLDGAIARAERIARRLRARGAGSELSPAIGIAQFRDEESLGHLIQRAAAALERARSSRGVVADRGPARSGPSRLRDDRSSALPA